MLLRLLSASVLMLWALGGQAADGTLIIGTKEAPPFSMKDTDNQWQGISIDLWRHIADGMDLEYEFREMSLAQLLQGAADGSLDGVVAALTVTAQREETVDFSHPFHSTGLAIAIPSGGSGSPWLRVLQGLMSPEFLKVVAALGLVLFVVGALVWAFEHRRNPEQFGGGTGRGLGSGFWWSAVTMTTVGYGDKAPVTLGGRIVALVWMFGAIIIISSFTAGITSALTVSTLGANISGPADLPKVRVGAVADTTSTTVLDERRIRHTAYPSLAEALGALADGKLDAVTYDAPILRYVVNQDFPETIQVLPGVFSRQDYAIALPPGSELREPVNRGLLSLLPSEQWRNTLFEHLGTDE